MEVRDQKSEVRSQKSANKTRLGYAYGWMGDRPKALEDPRLFELRRKVGLDVWPRPTKTIPVSLLISNAVPERVLP